MGRTPGMPVKDSTLKIRIAASLKERLAVHAIKNKRTFANETEFLLEYALDLIEGSERARLARAAR